MISALAGDQQFHHFNLWLLMGKHHRHPQQRRHLSENQSIKSARSADQSKQSIAAACNSLASWGRNEEKVVKAESGKAGGGYGF